MAINNFQAVTFNDGEPLDPTKLNQLSDNITNIYQSVVLSSSANGTNLQTPVIFTFRHPFKEVSAGKPQNIGFNFGGKFTKAELDAGKVHVTTGIRAAITDKDVITTSVGGATTENPTLYVNYSGDAKPRNISVDVIAVCMRDIA
jgi:hypothetical protein